MAAPQSTARRLRPGWVFLFAAALPFLTPSARAQSASNPPASAALSATDSGFVDVGAVDEVKNRMFRDMVRQRNQQRQKAIVDDTTQLLTLAQQLKAAVDKSDKDQLSLKVIDTAAEIEKLAKTVEKKMRNPD
jgi:hypothetical protein